MQFEICHLTKSRWCGWLTSKIGLWTRRLLLKQLKKPLMSCRTTIQSVLVLLFCIILLAYLKLSGRLVTINCTLFFLNLFEYPLQENVSGVYIPSLTCMVYMCHKVHVCLSWSFPLFVYRVLWCWKLVSCLSVCNSTLPSSLSVVSIEKQFIYQVSRCSTIPVDKV